MDLGTGSEIEVLGLCRGWKTGGRDVPWHLKEGDALPEEVLRSSASTGEFEFLNQFRV